MGNCRSKNNDKNDETELIKIINQGSFCNTYLIRKNDVFYINKKYSRYNNYIIVGGNYHFPIDIVNNEIEILNNINHQCILNIVNYIETTKYISVILPYIDGENLQYYAPKIITEKQLKWIVYQLMTALLYLKSKCILHRDIKPSNIIISDGDKVKLIDFNCAHYIQNKTEIAFGTLGYKAPEIHYNMEYSFNSDIFGFGCTIYYIVYKRMAIDIQMYKQPLTKWQNPIYTKSVYSKCLIDFIKRCIVYNKRSRYTIRDCYLDRWMFDYIIQIAEKNTINI